MPTGIYPKENRRKFLTEEHKRKIGEALKKPNSKEIRICKICGKQFEIYKCHIKDNRQNRGQFCSKVCFDKSQIGREPKNKGIKGLQTSWLKGKHLSEDQKQKLREYNLGRKLSKEVKEKISKAIQQLYKDEKFVKKRIFAQHIKPNNLELSFQKSLNNLLPNQYKYVGDGQFILGGKCPDFMNVNGQKKLIELFGNYWHKGENPQDRINHFRQFGFDTLVIWEKEIKDNLDIVKEKVINFNQG